jgi:DNA-binding MarR family transcriptional regulator
MPSIDLIVGFYKHYGVTMNPSLERIERELTVLVRRAQKVHLHAEGGPQPLDRAAYSILGRLHDDGPQRLGTLAGAFGVDPSTITRQVQSLEQHHLVARVRDPADRRACLLQLTDAGRGALQRTRDLRRGVMRDLLAQWSEDDRAAFAVLLERFNADLASARPDLALVSPAPPKGSTTR